MRFTATGQPMLNFSVAVNDAKAAEGVTEWVRVTAWGDDAERLNGVLTKGLECYIEGRLRLREWATADGTQRSGLDVSAWKVEPMGQIGRKAPRRPEQAEPTGGRTVDLADVERSTQHAWDALGHGPRRR